MIACLWIEQPKHKKDKEDEDDHGVDHPAPYVVLHQIDQEGHSALLLLVLR